MSHVVGLNNPSAVCLLYKSIAICFMNADKNCRFIVWEDISPLRPFYVGLLGGIRNESSCPAVEVFSELSQSYSRRPIKIYM